MSDLAKQQENGTKGEARTQAFLLDEFWVLRRSVDVDGADYLVQIQADTTEELEARQYSIQPFGVVQSKFFEGRNEVRLKRDTRSKATCRDPNFLFLFTPMTTAASMYTTSSPRQRL